MRVAIYQIDSDRLLDTSPALIRGLAQEIILGVTVAAAVDAGLYRQAYLVDVEGTDEMGMEQAFLAAARVADAGHIEAAAATARHPERSDLFVTENGDAWILQGSWFSRHAGPAPRFPAASANQYSMKDAIPA